MKTPLFIDFEASSLCLQNSYPVEVGYSTPCGNVYSHVILTHNTWNDPLKKDGEHIHKITDTAIQKHGKTCLQVCQHLNKNLLGQHVYSDCIKYDRYWLNRLFEASGEQVQFTLSDASLLFDDHTQPQAKELLRQYIANNPPPHRAKGDIAYLQNLYRLFNSWKV